ncbi:RNase A-like domain-containing protein [Nocardiopsis dassonvillei]
MSFEPTEPQNGVDPNPFTLIDPDTIPYPLTDVWSLNYAAETLRTGGEDLFGGVEDMSSTWHGVQAHYSAPESETLFAAMDPVVTRGEGIQSDLATVASALEDLAEAAATARRSLNTLRIDAQSLWNANHDKKVWWLNKDDETDEWALAENIRIKDAVNTAWSTFNEAENACATRISAVFGGPAYVSPDQAAGDGALVYGLPTDAGERDVSLENALSFEGVNSNINDFTAWAGSEFHPSLMDWGNPIGQAAWDTVITDALWGSAVGLTSKLGFWHPDNGWRFDPRGRLENFGAAWRDAGMDAATLVGIHDDHGWLWEPGAGGQEGWGAGFERWTGNAQDSLAEVWEGHTAWSTRDDGVAYSNTTIGANVALMTVGLPLKAVKIIAGAGVVSSMDAPGGSGDAEFDGSGPGSGGGSGTGSDNFTSRGGPGTRGWPSSPLPGAGEGQRPTGERFENPLTMLNNSLLDPERYRPPASTPTTPVPDGGGDRPSQNPPAPQPQDSGNEDSEIPTTEEQIGQSTNVQEGDGSPHRDEEGTDGDDRDDERSDLDGQQPSPEPAAGGAGGQGGSDEPPQTGGGDDRDEEGADEPGGESALGQENGKTNDIVPSDYIPGGSLQANEVAGGHALERHVDVSDDYLRRRTTGDVPGAPSGRVAGRYDDLETAELATAIALRNSEDEISDWLAKDMGDPDNRRHLLEEVDVGLGEIGFALERQGSKNNPTGWIPHRPEHVNVLLFYDESLPPHNYRIHTSYPIPKDE